MLHISNVFKASKDKGISLLDGDPQLSNMGMFHLIEKEEEVFHINEKVLFFAEFNMLSEPGAASILKFTNLNKQRMVESEEYYLYFYVTNQRIVFFIKTHDGKFHATSFHPKEDAFHGLKFDWIKSKDKEDDFKIHLVVSVQGFYKPVILGCETSKSILFCRRTFKETFNQLLKAEQDNI